ncbi:MULTISPECIES: pitrilysin family protein [unclassified Roseateles]|uniref:M16 family metallopeptidase n=1 Tax=unclassified Roseateles TaxID=2626991 RepID=UPI0006F47B24|nr:MULTISPECIES: pitrilysin family protein [unclassified Roseateles]KQW51412.1 zinc protease [Pelomonas sp. Root405]KRA77644.1 zinc protease [Pelomonas sp. Root662]
MKNITPAFRLGLLAAAVAIAGAVQAATVKTPAELPPFGKDKPLAVPKITQQTLPNGLQVWVVPRNGIPRVDYVLAVRGAGFGADAPDAPGRAKLLAGLLSEGTTQRSSKQIAEAAQAMGGAVGASASNDGISVAGNALASHAGAMAKLLAEVARQPAFPDGEVQLAKTNALQGLKAASTQPAFRAAKALDGAIYGGHAYGRTQETEAAINAVTAAGLRAEHARRFRPDRALLVITGRIDSAAALKLARDAFGDWKTSGEAVPELTPPPATAPVQRLLLERPGSVQATLRLGRPGMAASGDEQVALRLASTILGQGFSSRINQNLREEKGYTYGARAGGVSWRVGGAITGGADVRNEVTAASMTEYINEYRRIGTEPVPEAELGMNKRYMAGSYLVSTQLQGSVARQLASNWLVGLPAEFLGNFVPAIQKVTAAEVQAVGKKYFNPDEQSWVVVGDAAKIAEQLKAFGEFATVKP